MFKIIFTNCNPSSASIQKYSSYDNVKIKKMNLIDGKYTVECTEDYINYFNYKEADNKIKVGVIEFGQRLSVILQNKLLKLLEEDQESIHLMFIDNQSNILDTIKSRALIYYDDQQIFHFEKDQLSIFAKSIIISTDEYDSFTNDKIFFNQLFEIDSLLKEDKYISTMIKINKINLDAVKYYLLLRLIEKQLDEKKEYQLLEFAFELEKRANYNINYSLQIDNLMIKLINGK